MGYRRSDFDGEAFWRQAIIQQRQSGLSIRRWCAAQQLAETAFHYWRRTLAGRERQAASMPAFVPVVVRKSPGERRWGHITLRLRGGRVMRLPMDMAIEQVAALARAIEGSNQGGNQGEGQV